MRVATDIHRPQVSYAAARESTRLDFLDGLRGFAALVVFLSHAIGRVSPAFHDFTYSRFDMGSFGVTVFFLCSGFIIPVSLERQGSLRSFWLRRIFRLYPLYWFSIALFLLCYLAGLNPLPHDFEA